MGAGEGVRGGDGGGWGREQGGPGTPFSGRSLLRGVPTVPPKFSMGCVSID